MNKPKVNTSSKYYYADKLKVTHGPYSLEELYLMYQDFFIGNDTLIIKEGDSEWKAMASLGFKREPVLIAEEWTRPKKYHWLFPYRIKRLDYLFRMVVIHLIFSLPILTVFELAPSITNQPSGYAIYGGCALIYLFFLVSSIIIPRFRDIGLGWVYAFVTLVPGINVLCLLAALFIPKNGLSLDFENYKKRIQPLERKIPDEYQPPY
ncbi:MAG: GYF domain-containing protein [Verrucomicrobiota bacterium]